LSARCQLPCGAGVEATDLEWRVDDRQAEAMSDVRKAQERSFVDARDKTANEEASEGKKVKRGSGLGDV